MKNFAQGLAVGVFVWMLIGVIISGATWHLYDIAWVAPVIAGVTAMMLLVAVFDRREI